MIDPTHLRLSELALCPRACACRGLGLHPAEPTERMRNLFERGHMDEAWIAKRYKARYAPKRVYRNVAIEWPLGVGHADLVVPSARLITEVKSTAYMDSMFDQAVRQVRQYLRFYRDGYRGAVHFLNPATMEETVVPVLLHSGHIEQIDQEVEAVRVGLLPGEPLPPCRLGDTPRTCRCQFKESGAWEGYEEPVVLQDESLPPWAKQNLSETWEEYRLARARMELAEAEYDKAKEVLLELGLNTNMDYRLHDVLVRVSEVAGRETFSLKRARSSGEWTELDQQRFDWAIKIGEPSLRWTVKRLSSGADGSGPAPAVTQPGTPEAPDTHSVHVDHLQAATQDGEDAQATEGKVTSAR